MSAPAPKRAMGHLTATRELVSQAIAPKPRKPFETPFDSFTPTGAGPGTIGDVYGLARQHAQRAFPTSACVLPESIACIVCRQCMQTNSLIKSRNLPRYFTGPRPVRQILSGGHFDPRS